MKSILVLALLVGGSLIASGQAPAQSPSQGTVRTIAAAEDLNEAARAYRDGNFEEALGFAERALSRDPLNKTAPLFIARILHRQYKPGDQSPANLAKAREAIEAYMRLLANQRDNEEAYKAIASLYGAIKEDELQRQWIMQRAADTSFSPEQRAEAYVVLASKQWYCSNTITDLPANKETIVKRNTVVVHYYRPSDDADFQKAQQCVQSGLEMVGMAIVLTPDNLAAWSYKQNLLLERLKLVEMDGNISEKALLTEQLEEAKRRTDELSAKSMKQQP